MLKLEIKEEHIQKAKELRESNEMGYNLVWCCPIALAATERFGVKSSMGRRALYVGDLREVVFYPSVEAMVFINLFDSKGEVKPTTLIFKRREDE